MWPIRSKTGNTWVTFIPVGRDVYVQCVFVMVENPLPPF